jgi:methylenetetrahydrofolate reductase (NADPH)
MRIGELIRPGEPVFSFEFFPPKTDEGVEALFAVVEQLSLLRPDFASVTYGAGGATREGTLEVATRLIGEHGIETMAHLSCVGETISGLEEILGRIEAVGIENVLALRGDPPRGASDFEAPAGGLSSAAELVEFISARHEFAIGATCFPEVHPEAQSLEADLAYLKTKVDAGAQFLITQLFFDNESFWAWRDQARQAGIEVPIMVGVMPITSYSKLRRFCELCEAVIPDALADALAACEGDQRAEAELGIAYASRQCEELLAGGVAGIHFYTLNEAPATRAILAALRAAQPWKRAGGTAEPVTR